MTNAYDRNLARESWRRIKRSLAACATEQQINEIMMHYGSELGLIEKISSEGYATLMRLAEEQRRKIQLRSEGPIA